MNSTKKFIVEEPIPGAAWRVIRGAGASEFDALAKGEGFHALDVEDCRHRRQLAKVVDRDGYVFIVVKSIRYEARSFRLSFDDFNLFVKRASIITVEEEANTIIERVRRRFDDKTIPRDPAHILHSILDEIIDEYLLTLDSIREDVDALESHVWKDPSSATLRRIFQARRTLADFRRNAGFMREAVSSLIRHPQIPTNGDLENYYRDLYEHAIRVMEFSETYRETLSGMLEIYLSAVANRTNEIVKALTVYGTISLPPIVITGLYGMNVELPFQHSPHAFLIVFSVILVFTGVVLLYFRKKGWF